MNGIKERRKIPTKNTKVDSTKNFIFLKQIFISLAADFSLYICLFVLC